MPDRYYKSQQDVQADIETRRMNAENMAARAAQEQYAQQQANSFVAPTGLVSTAQQMGGFGANYGTGAGGNAYIMGVDYGANVTPPDVLNEKMRYGVQPGENPMYQEEKNLENVDNLTPQYYDNVSQLHKLSSFAARNGFNITSPDPMDKNQMVFYKQYKDLLGQTKYMASQLNEGYRAQEMRAKNPNEYRSVVGTGAGEYRSTQMQDLSGTDLHPVIHEFNSTMQPVYYDTKSYKSKVAEADALKQQFYQMSVMAQQNGDMQSAMKWAEQMKAIETPVYDPSKNLDRGLEQQKINDARNKKPASRYSNGVSEGDIGSLKELIFRMREHGDTGVISQDLPGANVTDVGGNRYLEYIPKGSMTNEPVRINLDNEEAVANAIIENNPKFAKMTVGDIQEFEKDHPNWAPPKDINFRVNKSMDNLDKLITNFNDDKISVDDVVKEISPILKLGKVGTAKIVDVKPSSDLIGSSDNVTVTLDDGSEVDYDLGGWFDASSDLKKIIDSVPINSLYNLSKEQKDKNKLYFSSETKYGSSQESGPKVGDTKQESGYTFTWNGHSWE